MQVNIWKIIYLNCGERYEDMADHRSYIHNLSSCEIKAWKQFRPERDSNPWPLRYRCSCLPTELSSQQGADHVVCSWYTRRWWRIQVNIWKMMYLNCGERYEDMADHRSYTHNLCSCKIKAWKKIQAWTGIEPMTSAIPVQCSTNWASKTTGSWSRCELVRYA